MEITSEYLQSIYKEFEIFFRAIQDADGLWHVDFQVFLGNRKIDGAISPQTFPTKAAAGNAALGYAIASAEQWRLAFEQKQSPIGDVILVWGVLYRFPSAQAAADARQWLAHTNATHEQFEAKYREFQISLPRHGLDY
ncbi:hypothetical protein [Massilia sp.]|uniref:hypothetical protein n=1 Tax=Massilia sp. TaxID=1882437 RepID=UPI00289EA87C|nr:hypothetical protein [Massilia sp.]